MWSAFLTQQQTPGSVTHPDTWFERWGAIGVVAFIALGALVMVGKQWLAERSRDKEKAEADAKAAGEERARQLKAAQDALEAQRQATEALNNRLIEVVQVSHKETLALLDTQRALAAAERLQLRTDHAAAVKEAQERFDELLERSLANNDRVAGALEKIADKKEERRRAAEGG